MKISNHFLSFSKLSIAVLIVIACFVFVGVVNEKSSPTKMRLTSEKKKEVQLIDPQNAKQVPIGRVVVTPQGESDSVIASASAYFTKAKRCVDAANAMDVIESRITFCQSPNLPTEAVQGCQNQLNKLAIQLESIKSTSGNCSAMDAASQNKKYYEDTVKSAELGDVNAQICYIKGDFDIKVTDLEVEQYKVDSRNFIQEALERGDWRIVQILGTSSRALVNPSGSPLLRYTTTGDNFSVYRANRLLRFGSTGSYGSMLDGIADGLRGSLSPNDVIKADEWAEDMYKNYFQRSPILSSAPTPCQNEFRPSME